MSLFKQLEHGAASRARSSSPLADRMRPQTLDEFLGQEHLLGAGKPLRKQIEQDEIGSMILWGPPGCGKTTLAMIIARQTRARFVPFSAVLSGIKEIKQVMLEAERTRQHGERTIVFVDEVHRFNKAQQDAFLPHVERGNIIFIGATTENPSFEVISPLLSRTRVYLMSSLTTNQVAELLKRALADPERGLGKVNLVMSDQLMGRIAEFANRDARAACNILEALALGISPDSDGRRVATQAVLEAVIQRKTLLYDKAGEEHFNLISALHKSVRNSDPDAALYWLARMLEAGEDPLYVARRLVRMASEDIGLADPGALAVTVAAMHAADFVGMPEGNLALAQAAVYLSLAPKSNALYTGYGSVQHDLQAEAADPVPLHLRNATTDLMSSFGYGKGYQYAHDSEDKVTNMPCLPQSLQGRTYYRPTDEGFEKRLRQRLEEIRNIKAKVPAKGRT